MKLCPKCQKQFSDDANFCPVDAARLVPLESQAAAVDPISAKFDLGDRLGGSRTGTVHRATDKATGQAAAVKVIAPAVVTLPGLAQRLERELKQLERVQSAGVAKVLASGKRGDETWVALELLDGAQTLAEAVAARGPIPLDQAAQLIEVVGEALIEAAQVGVVHRDLAPKNILFAGAEVKLINFSLPVPTNEKVPGVPEFVAPEQHEGKPVDQRSNLYSLGALYYYVLTGQPVQLDDAGTVKAPSSLSAVPGPIEAVIMRALDRSPTKRFLTVRQFVDEVSRVARGEADIKTTQPLGRAGKPRAELVQTLLGMRGEGLVPATVAESPSAPASIAPSIAPPGPSTAIGMVAPPGPSMAAGMVASNPSAAAIASSTTPPGPSTAIGMIAPNPSVAAIAPSNAPPEMPAPLSAAAAERSPWAPPSDLGPQGHAAVQAAELAVATPAATTPGMVPVTALAPAAAVSSVPASMLAEPPQGKTGGKKASKSGEGGKDSKGQFRETMWFKKGELDAQAAQAAAEERAKTGKDVSADKADSLPLDERYKDDGSLSRSDKEKYSLRTGRTTGTAALRDSRPSDSVGKVSEDALIDEMKGGRNKIFVFIVIGLIAVALIVFLVAR